MSTVTLFYGRLMVTTPGRSIEYEVTSESVNVGRSPDGNQLVLDDAEVSRWHCRFEFSEKTRKSRECRVIDLQSANGTVVAGKRVEDADGCIVKDGDIVSMGVSEIKFFAPSKKDLQQRSQTRIPKLSQKKSIQKKAPSRKPLREVKPEAEKEEKKEAEEEISKIESSASKRSAPVAKKKKKKQQIKKLLSPRRGGPVGRISKAEGKPRLSKGSCLSNIKEIAERRNKRREEQRKKHALAQEKRSSLGSDQDLTFVQMVDSWRQDNVPSETSEESRRCVLRPNAKIRVCVRKRPMNKTESKRD
eukprot:g3125.t1